MATVDGRHWGLNQDPLYIGLKFKIKYRHRIRMKTFLVMLSWQQGSVVVKVLGVPARKDWVLNPHVHSLTCKHAPSYCPVTTWIPFGCCHSPSQPDSEVARAGRDLEVFFLEQLRHVFCDRTFPMASQDRTDQARLHWLNRKRKENYRKKKHVFSGKRYFL